MRLAARIFLRSLKPSGRSCWHSISLPASRLSHAVADKMIASWGQHASLLACRLACQAILQAQCRSALDVSLQAIATQLQGVCRPADLWAHE